MHRVVILLFGSVLQWSSGFVIEVSVRIHHLTATTASSLPRRRGTMPVPSVPCKTHHWSLCSHHKSKPKSNVGDFSATLIHLPMKYYYHPDALSACNSTCCPEGHCELWIGAVLQDAWQWNTGIQWSHTQDVPGEGQGLGHSVVIACFRRPRTHQPPYRIRHSALSV